MDGRAYRQCRRLVVGAEGELMVEFENEMDADALAADLKERFEDQVLLAP